MQAEWRNAKKTILALTEASGHVVIVEPGHALWPAASALADIAPFAPAPAAEPGPAERRAGLAPLTRRQLFLALYGQGHLTGPEALAAAATGAVPGALEPAFAALPEPDQTEARIAFATFREARRLDPLITMIARAAGLSDAEIDAIWTRFAAV